MPASPSPAPDTDAIVRVRGLSKTYAGGFQALKNIDLDIRRGEIFALLGPNGAGKTTLISVICGMNNATAGTVTVDGVPWHTRRVSLAERRRRARLVQMVFQDPYLSLDRRQTVAACLEESLRLHFPLSAWPVICGLVATAAGVVGRIRRRPDTTVLVLGAAAVGVLLQVWFTHDGPPLPGEWGIAYWATNLGLAALLVAAVVDLALARPRAQVAPRPRPDSITAGSE